MGFVFAPLMWLIGIASVDIMPMGQLLGIKLSINEFIAYMQLADFQSSSSLVNLKYQKSVIMATYMLCGFANFSSIGIQIGGIGSLAPNQKKKHFRIRYKSIDRWSRLHPTLSNNCRNADWLISLYFLIFLVLHFIILQI